MKIILSESKFKSLLKEMYLSEYHSFDGNSYRNPYAKNIQLAKDALDKLLSVYGTVMSNIENGKDYMTYELYSLADALGKRYCVCKLLKDDKPYGQVSIKPLQMFKTKNY